MRRRLIWTCLFAALVVVPAFSQDAEAREEVAEQQPLMNWRWANFALLALGLGYLIVKNGPAFFNARSETIQKAIQDATGLKVDADFRASEMDRRMATLSTEVDKMRHELAHELENERKRVEAETHSAIVRIHEQSERDAAAVREHANLTVRRDAVRLATDFALTHLRDNPAEINQDILVRDFARSVQAQKEAR